jgi:hypothetical protein
MSAADYQLWITFSRVSMEYHCWVSRRSPYPAPSQVVERPTNHEGILISVSPQPDVSKELSSAPP